MMKIPTSLFPIMVDVHGGSWSAASGLRVSLGISLSSMLEHNKHKTSILGLFTVIVSLVTASFVQCVVHLILTQGLLYGVGGSLLYSPFIFYLDEWFDRWKGFAYGFLWAGTAVGGTVGPLILEWGLKKYGFRIMLRAWASLLVDGSCLFLDSHIGMADHWLPGCVPIAVNIHGQAKTTGRS